MNDKSNSLSKIDESDKQNSAESESRLKANQMVWDAIGSDYGFCNPIKCRIADEDDDDND